MWVCSWEHPDLALVGSLPGSIQPAGFLGRSGFSTSSSGSHPRAETPESGFGASLVQAAPGAGQHHVDHSVLASRVGSPLPWGVKGL